jgi:hypothetical protein
VVWRDGDGDAVSRGGVPRTPLAAVVRDTFEFVNTRVADRGVAFAIEPAIHAGRRDDELDVTVTVRVDGRRVGDGTGASVLGGVLFPRLFGAGLRYTASVDGGPAIAKLTLAACTADAERFRSFYVRSTMTADDVSTGVVPQILPPPACHFAVVGSATELVINDEGTFVVVVPAALAGAFVDRASFVAPSSIRLARTGSRTAVATVLFDPLARVPGPGARRRHFDRVGSSATPVPPPQVPAHVPPQVLDALQALGDIDALLRVATAPR